MVNDLSTLIGAWSISETLCDSMVKDFESKAEHHKQTHSVRGYTYLTSFDCNASLIYQYEIEIGRALAHYTTLFPHSKETIAAFQLDPTYNIQKYLPGNHYSVWHCENNGEKLYSNRHLAFMTYLNTVEDGGETEFLHQNTKIKPKKGTTLIWPAHFTHIHRGLPAKSEVKYVTTGWFTFFNTENFLNSSFDMNDEDFFNGLDEINSKVA